MLKEDLKRVAFAFARDAYLTGYKAGIVSAGFKPLPMPKVFQKAGVADLHGEQSPAPLAQGTMKEERPDLASDVHEANVRAKTINALAARFVTQILEKEGELRKKK